MEGLNQKSLERIVSQKALQMGSSFQCQICVVGFICGIGLTSLFLATLTSLGTFGISFADIYLNTSFGSSSSSPEIISESNILISYFFFFLVVVKLLGFFDIFLFLFLFYFFALFLSCGSEYFPNNVVFLSFFLSFLLFLFFPSFCQVAFAEIQRKFRNGIIMQ